MATITAKQVSSLLVPMLIRMVKLISTVSRVPAGEFSGRNGDTVTVAVPQPTASRTQAVAGADIVFDDIDEVGVDVVLEHEYHAKLISDEQQTFELVDFARQITKPQVSAVVTGAEDKLATVLNDLAADSSFALNATAADTKAQVKLAMLTLDQADVPDEDRYLTCAPDIAARLLDVDEFVKANESGDGGEAKRRGVVGEVFGFTVVKSNALTAGTASAYHESGLAWANTGPKAPEGDNVDAETVTDNGVTMRQLFQYIATKLSNSSVVSTFAGAALVDADRVVKFDTAVA